MFVYEKLKHFAVTHSLNSYQDELDRAGAHKRMLVAEKEELNFEDLQERNNLLLK